jgi:tetratricopeptide (TPR) repeat protein
MRRALSRALRAGLLGVALFAQPSCGGAPTRPADALLGLRHDASASADAELVGRLLLGELYLPGGSAKTARKARARLDALMAKGARGMWGSLGRAIDDDAHGRFKSSADAFVEALVAASSSHDPDAGLVAWYASIRLQGLRASASGLYARHDAALRTLLKSPGNIGWRARAELVRWWAAEGYVADLAKPGFRLPEALPAESGCLRDGRIAGPFGRGAPSDRRTIFAPERSGTWPLVFHDPDRSSPPRTHGVERSGCLLRAKTMGAPGIYYLETFIELTEPRELVVAVEEAFSIKVDDREVLTRDLRSFGAWVRYGAQVSLRAGRHRIVARIPRAETSVFVLDPSGAPLGLAGSSDPAPGYTIEAPTLLPSPNELEPFVLAAGLPRQVGVPEPPKSAAQRDASSPLARLLAAKLAYAEGQGDVASVLFEPFVRDDARATGPALALQAAFAERDPVLGENEARDLAKDLRGRAAARDEDLWWPSVWLALDQADKTGLGEAARKLRELEARYPEVPDIGKVLAELYGQAGWRVERRAAIARVTERFPDDLEALDAWLRELEEGGELVLADRVAARILAQRPDAEVTLERALAREDWDAAVTELRRIADVRKDRRDIAGRIAEVLARAGKARDSLERIEEALEREPTNARHHLSLADARFARGDKGALARSIAGAIERGADTEELRAAVELLDGVSELSPYRVDGRKAIAEFEASKVVLPGTAARVLDYATIYVHEDGSARMLEHEIIRVQSREGIAAHVEQRLPRGVVLRLRTIKKDGRVLEPEIVAQKPTATMPHLEEGDYVETEWIVPLRGSGGRVFQGPRWFFREEGVSYHRSELVVVTPEARKLDVETTGAVPEPTVTRAGGLVTRRWRVDGSLALPEEPLSAPLVEFMPSVRLGWGIDRAVVVRRFADSASDETPRDPRLVRIAQTIAGKGTDGERARRIYRWVLDKIEPGRESDGRRIVLSQRGVPTEAFVYLARLAGLEVSLGLVADRLTPPPLGPMSEAERYSALALRVRDGKEVVWLQVRSRFAPFGYLPSSLRGQPAIVLADKPFEETTPVTGAIDEVVHEGQGTLSEEGALTLALTTTYRGKLAIALRTALHDKSDNEVRDRIEGGLLPQVLPGAQVRKLEVVGFEDVDKPLVLKLDVSLPSFARVRGRELVVTPPFSLRLSPAASLARRETPLYIGDSNRIVVRLDVKLPTGATVTSELSKAALDDHGRKVEVGDRASEGRLALERLVDVPAGRVPTSEYRAFQEYARAADAALLREIVVRLP